MSSATFTRNPKTQISTNSGPGHTVKAHPIEEDPPRDRERLQRERLRQGARVLDP